MPVNVLPRKRIDRVARALWSSGVARLAGATYVTTLFGVITGPLSSRALGPTGRGEAAVVLTAVLLVTIVLSTGLGPAIGHVLTNAKASPAQSLGASLRFAMIMALPAGTFAAAFYWMGATQDLSTSIRTAGSLLIMLAPLYPVTQALEYILVTHGDLESLARIRLISFSSYFVLVVSLFILRLLTPTAFVGGTALQGLVTLVLFWRSAGVRPARGLRLAPLVRYGLRDLIGSLLGFANLRADQLLLAPLVGFDDVGIYAVAVTIAILPLGLASAISARALSTSGTADALRVENVGMSLRRVVLLTAGSSAVLGLAAPLILPLAYGPKFEAAAVALVLLLPGTVALGATGTAFQCLTVLGRPGRMTMAEIVGLVANALLLLTLVPPLGIYGAAIASSIAYGVRFLVVLHAIRASGLSVRQVVPGWSDVRVLVARLGQPS